MNFLLSCFTPRAKFKVSSTMTALSISHCCSLPSSGTVCARCVWHFLLSCAFRHAIFKVESPSSTCQSPSPLSVFLWLRLCALSRSVVSNSFVTPWTIACQAPSGHGISQARILERVATSSSRGFAQPRDQTVSPVCPVFPTMSDYFPPNSRNTHYTELMWLVSVNFSCRTVLPNTITSRHM